MYQRKSSLAVGLAGALVALSGCSTFSFAPPSVQTDFKVSPSATVCGQNNASEHPIEKNFRGARDLIDNFTVTYRCSLKEAADGRQIFEVPSFLALVTAAIGPTFGLSGDQRIAAISAASVYGRANSYYAPREKLPALDAALDAVLCVKSESIGLQFYDTRAGDVDAARAAVTETQTEMTKTLQSLSQLEAKRSAAVAELKKLATVNDASTSARTALTQELGTTEKAIADSNSKLKTLEVALAKIVSTSAVKATASIGIAGVDDSALTVSANEQYFEMVGSALLSVERILGNRLKSAGRYDPAGLQAEIGKANQEMANADKDLKGLRSDGTSGVLELEDLGVEDQSKEIALRLEAIRPRLQQCVVRAKLG